MSDRTVWIVVAVALLALYMVTRKKRVVVPAYGVGATAAPNSTLYVNGQPIASGRAAQGGAAQAVALGVAAAPAVVSIFDSVSGLFSSPTVAGSEPVTSDFGTEWTDDSTDNYDGMDLLGS